MLKKITTHFIARGVVGIIVVCLASVILSPQAFAQTLTIDFDTPDAIIFEGIPLVSFTGTLTNTGSETLFLDADENTLVGLDSGSPNLPITSYFFDPAFPVSIAAGSSLTNIHFFDVDTTLIVPDVYTGTYRIRATGATSGNTITPASKDYTITAFAAVPEVGTGILYATVCLPLLPLLFARRKE